MTIKDFGTHVADVWAGLRPLTRKMVVGAMRIGQTNNNAAPEHSNKFLYDAHADWELSRLLTALDERAKEAEAKNNPQNHGEIRKMANACAEVLGAQTESAEIFIQLMMRALSRADFARVDTLADALQSRFSIGELCEIARQADNAAIRAIAMEALALVSPFQLLSQLDDPLYADIVRQTLETQAVEYNVDDARMLLEDLGNERFWRD